MKPTGPRSSLLLALFATGIAVSLAAAKGHLPSWFAIVGTGFMLSPSVFLFARAWCLRKTE